jgi:hypothetical protein
MQIKKGCVYFFKHVGLSPVKIGYSNNESPFNRFNQFKTYAPFGSEILGFIIISDAIELEQQLHKKYASKRLEGEWFDLTEEEVKKEIDFYTNVSDIKDRNEFQIAWAKHVLNKKQNIENQFKTNKKTSKLDVFKKMYFENKDLNRSWVAEHIGVTRQTIIKWIKQIDG